jgi:hypothetical protein
MGEWFILCLTPRIRYARNKIWKTLQTIYERYLHPICSPIVSHLALWSSLRLMILRVWRRLKCWRNI